MQVDQKKGPLMDWALRHCQAAAAQGVPVERLLLDSMIDPNRDMQAELADDDLRLRLLWLNVIASLEDEFHGFASRPMALGTTAISLRLMLDRETLLEALQEYAYFFRLISREFKWNLHMNRDAVTFAFELDRSSRLNPHTINETHVVATHMFASWFCGRPIPLLGFTTPNTRYPSLNIVLGAAGKCPIVPSTHTAIRFPRYCLAWRRRAIRLDNLDDFIIRHFYTPHSQWSEYERIASSKGYASRVLNMIETQPNVSFVQIAEHLRMPPVTLRRYLHRENTGYREISTLFRVKRATELLTGTSDKVEAIAEELGFSDARELRRCLKRVTGKTPNDIRTGNLSQPPSAMSEEWKYREVLKRMTHLNKKLAALHADRNPPVF